MPEPDRTESGLNRSGEAAASLGGASTPHALDALLPLVYQELRRIASDYLRQDRRDHTLQPTALVHEALLKMSKRSNADWRDEAHVRAVAAMAMRQILVDSARAKESQKRGGKRLRVTMDHASPESPGLDFDVLALDDALQQLGEIDERRARVVEMHFFGGLTFSEIGGLLGLAQKTAEADWYFARAWLRKQLASGA